MSLSKPSAFLDNYTIMKCMDQSCGILYFASDNISGSHVVLKTFPCAPTVKLSYIQERNHLRRLNHPNIVNLHTFKDTAILISNNIGKKVSYLVLEHVPFGDLCDMLMNSGAFPEVLVRMIFHQVMDAITYLHENGTAHMDLKAENIVMDNSFNVKIIDFDQSLHLGTKNFRSKGTPGYRCPEVIRGLSDDLKACDVYSLGVILFILLTGCQPYMEQHNKLNEVRFDDYYRLLGNNPEEFWQKHARAHQNDELFSDSFKILVTSMLSFDPLHRCTMEDVKNSEWYNGPVYTGEEYEREMRKYLRI